jgi:hypothetical protein
MAHNIRRHDPVRWPFALADAPRCFLLKKAAHGSDALGGRDFRHVGGWLYLEMPNACSRHVLQQHPVVATDLEDEWIVHPLNITEHILCELRKMLAHGSRSRRRVVRILPMKHALPIGHFHELNHVALWTEGYRQITDDSHPSLEGSTNPSANGIEPNDKKVSICASQILHALITPAPCFRRSSEIE